jgi:DnaJ-domain-containing protein 1
MIDNFALLNEPRRPWIEPDDLKEKFISLSSEVHPDRLHNASAAEKESATKRYAELNAAYNCLREPKDRLRHLLELTLGKKLEEIQQVPAGMMEEAFEVGSLCRKVDAFLGEKEKATSPMLKVQFFERGQEWVDKLNELQGRISKRRESVVEEIKQIDSIWDGGAKSNSTLDRLDEIHRLLSYFNRWTGQIQERILSLSF